MAVAMAPTEDAARCDDRPPGRERIYGRDR